MGPPGVPAPRILHVMWTLGLGGAERAVFQLIREQRRRGMSADVLLGSEAGFYGELLRESGAAVHQLDCRGAWDARRSYGLRAMARRYTIVHFHAVEPLLIAAISRASSTIVYTHRGGVRRYGWVKRSRLAAARPFVRRFDAHAANSEQGARAASKWLGLPLAHISVVYNGLDFDLLEPRRGKQDVLAELPTSARSCTLVGTASNFNPWKRVERLLRAVARTRASLHCVVLGDGPRRGSMERFASSLGISDRVTFLGRKEHVGDYLQLLDIFVLPSGPEEGFGNAAVEAMGVGIPTVVFADGGGLTEHVIDGETGRTVESVDELAVVLTELASDSARRRELGIQGERYVRSTYSVGSMFERYMRLYDRALTHHR